MKFQSNNVELLGYYGGDDTHALSAWTSTTRDITEEKLARRPKLLRFLAENKHHTPFEKSYLHFLVTCDTASHIHILKHRIGVNVNGESARYREHKEDKAYTPPDWPLDMQEEYEKYVELGFELYHRAVLKLEEARGRKRAKESARFFLPYGSQLTLDVGFNFRSFMHFLGLRLKDDAQDEIWQIAADMLDLVRETGAFKESLAGFGY